MPDSVYKIVELVGSSPNSWEEATKAAVEKAAESLRDLRVAEVKELDVKLENGKIVAYRAKVRVSFKIEGEVT
jgi:flavin-binding protein dodecin